MLATLLRNAATETCCPDDPSHDMPWYERENYIAQAVITAGWAAPNHHPAPEHDPGNEPPGEQLSFKSVSGGVKYPVSQFDWSGWYATVTDPAKRAERTAELQRIALRELPIIP
ncbi:hypothetical protein, partial [Streptomyces sp. NPDC002082]|uniref:hypothetical protein n=1 Tax=Streptomyces sp. NPDC002082 TaxID=3154772 RepID=UPI00331ECCD5